MQSLYMPPMPHIISLASLKSFVSARVALEQRSSPDRLRLHSSSNRATGFDNYRPRQDSTHRIGCIMTVSRSFFDERVTLV
jgi:hypothetical protein